MKTELTYQLAHLYNEAKAIVIKRTTGSSLAPLAMRLDEEELVEVMKEFLVLIDKNGLYIQPKPESKRGQLSVDPLPRGKLLE